MAFDSKSFAEYFILNNLEIDDYEGEKFKTFDKKNNLKYCFKQKLEEIFAISIPCSHYESVAFGQGHEIDKIETIYSSSLQSLLIFSQVSEHNKITVGKDTYDEVHFEYKNKAFGYPSCIDVVLINRKEKKILFIESKLSEIIRDSTIKGTKKIGPSYFGPGGYSLIELYDKKKLSSIGINVPENINIGKDSPNTIKLEISKITKNNSKGWTAVEKIEGCKYVYSEGIKQILSHLLGIYYFKNLLKEDIPSNCDSYLYDCKDYECKFIEIHNHLPNYPKDKNDSDKKISDFLSHVKKTFKFFENCSIMTYQDLYNETKNKNYFNKINKIVEFYHLNTK